MRSSLLSWRGVSSVRSKMSRNLQLLPSRHRSVLDRDLVEAVLSQGSRKRPLQVLASFHRRRASDCCRCLLSCCALGVKRWCKHMARSSLLISLSILTIISQHATRHGTTIASLHPFGSHLSPHRPRIHESNAKTAGKAATRIGRCC